MANVLFVSDNLLTVNDVTEKVCARGAPDIETKGRAVCKNANGDWEFQLPENVRQLIHDRINAQKLDLRKLQVQSVKVSGSDSEGKGRFYCVPDGLTFDNLEGKVKINGEFVNVPANGTIGLNRIFQNGRGRMSSHAKAWEVIKDAKGLWAWVNPDKTPAEFVGEGSVHSGPSAKDMMAELLGLVKSGQNETAALRAELAALKSGK